MVNSLAIVLSGFPTFCVAVAIYAFANRRNQPARGTRLPLGQIEQNIQHENIQHEKKSTSSKPPQRPASVPNLKSLFNGNTKKSNDENRDIEKTAQSEYLPTTYNPPVRKGLPKRNTIIFRDPILKTVEEVDAAAEDDNAAPSITTEQTRAVSRVVSSTLEDALIKLPASQCESIIESTKDITLAQPDANKHNLIADVASASQTTHTIPTALPQISEPEIQAILEAAPATKLHLNPSSLSNTGEPSVQDEAVVSKTIEAQTKLPALSAAREPVLHTVSSSPELNKSLVVTKSRGPTKQKSNPALPMAADIRHNATISHVAREQSATRYVPQTDIPMISQTRSIASAYHGVPQLSIPTVSEDRSFTVLHHDVPPPSVTVKEAFIAASVQDTVTEDNFLNNVSVSGIPMVSKDRKVSSLYGSAPAPATSVANGPDVPLHKEPIMNKASSINTRKSSLEDGPPPQDSNGPKGLRAAVANSIKASASRPWKPSSAPTDAQQISVKKRRDATLRAANYPQPMPWAPAAQHPGTHQHTDSCAVPGMIGPKAVQSRYLTPYTYQGEIYGLDTAIEGLYGADAAKQDYTYDSYDEDDGYVTAPTTRFNGETTNDGATTDFYPRWDQKARREIADAMALVESSRTQEDVDDEAGDPTMVAEYADEIFAHLRELEVKMLPNPHYMEDQTELQWSMRAVLMDWLVQVHGRCNLLPETLFICGNFVDRFLSGKIVSLGKLQLVGATALFLAAKKEEINCPTLSEIVFMVDNTYTSDELIKAERYMLNILGWELEWPGPMSFLRRISKADDYDLETRTLAKYFLEVTLMEERFIGTPCSFTAAASHCIARLLLGKGLWTHHHVYYSNYTYSQLYPLLQMLLYCVENPLKHHAAVYEKYADKRYKRAATYVEVELRRGFTLPDPPKTSARNLVDDLVAPYAMTPYYNNPFNYHLATGPVSGRVFSN